MRDYSKVSATFWTGKTGRAIRGDVQTQIVALYLLTSPHSNMIGVYNCPIQYIAHETGSPLEGATNSLSKLVEMGFCEYDHENEIVWVLEMARYQIGEQLSPNDNQVKSIQKQFDSLYEGPIKSGFFDRYANDFCLKGSTSPSEAPPKPEAGTGEEAGKEKKHLPKTKVEFDGKTFSIPDHILSVWKTAYPAVNLVTEIAAAAAWIIANPANTKSNWSRYLTNWLKRAQDRAPKAGGGVAPAAAKSWRDSREGIAAKAAEFKLDITGMQKLEALSAIDNAIIDRNVGLRT